MDTKHQQKNNIQEKDVIIVGQGIAGTVLALSYLWKGYSVCVISNNKLSLSSRVAAGIWNPVVFKRLTKTWMADDLIPNAKLFYQQAEITLNIPLYSERQILKPFNEKQEEIFWLKKSHSENPYLHNQILQDYEISSQKKISSYSYVKEAGYINILDFLNSSQNYLISKDSYYDTDFKFDDFKSEHNVVKYQNIVAKRIVFCEGHLISNNPYFCWVPLKPAKGETLTIKSDDIHLNKSIFNKGFYILPLGNKLYKIGATYEWENLNDHPTEKGKNELVKKLSEAITTDFEIINHDAGIRPSVIDRRPVVGNHPEQKTFSVFNGFGTKGVIIAPYFANYLIDLNANKVSENSEVSPLRFYKK